MAPVIHSIWSKEEGLSCFRPPHSPTHLFYQSLSLAIETPPGTYSHSGQRPAASAMDPRTPRLQPPWPQPPVSSEHASLLTASRFSARCHDHAQTAKPYAATPDTTIMLAAAKAHTETLGTAIEHEQPSPMQQPQVPHAATLKAGRHQARHSNPELHNQA
ncbi:hypothetical protein MDA_GLEAN10003262 [Myotis davidii]|uniref:Uncharacterized protein n=1 Tax=Myotis davidii TaxID=225400 RepID=L5ML82_MYODS|nr:hypothetical protein MDA_GLEAN10003262 [Myotis davidii]